MEDKYPQILFVDDEDYFLSSIRRLLANDFELTTTNDPRDALRMVKTRGPFAAVVADFKMPAMSGIDLLSQVHLIDKSVQRILLTGVADFTVAIEAINRGKATAFLTKPISKDALSSALHDAIKAYRDSRLGTYRLGESSDLLTMKESEILLLLARGLSNAEIAREIFITVGTVKNHMNNIFHKMNVNSRSKVVAKGIELGLIVQNR
ncbi:MAG: response regulator transcription factor [Negativicutes bacterium]|nr:response regulator transcription factor [Negativicutes bacterium]